MNQRSSKNIRYLMIEIHVVVRTRGILLLNQIAMEFHIKLKPLIINKDNYIIVIANFTLTYIVPKSVPRKFNVRSNV